MSDNLRRYRAIRDACIQYYPGQPSGTVARHLTTLAALLSGIVGSTSTQLPNIAARLLLDSGVVIGQFLCNSLFFQAFHEGRDRCRSFGKSRLISSPYILSRMCESLSEKSSWVA